MFFSKFFSGFFSEGKRKTWNEEEVRKEIEGIVKEHLEGWGEEKTESISGRASFVDELGLDSLSLIQIQIEIEDSFDINLPNSNRESPPDSIDDLFQVVKEALAEENIFNFSCSGRAG